MILEAIQALAGVATAVGAFLAAYQLFLTKKQAVTSFEEALNARYRQLVERMPLDALLGKEINVAELETHRKSFYLYFDLSNEQVFLWRKGQVSRETWKNWHEGISQHLRRPAFMQAWRDLEAHLDGSFDHLREVFPELERRQ